MRCWGATAAQPAAGAADDRVEHLEVPDLSVGTYCIPAGEEHRFVDVTEDLALLVVFGPAYGSRGGTGESDHG